MRVFYRIVRKSYPIVYLVEINVAGTAYCSIVGQPFSLFTHLSLQALCQYSYFFYSLNPFLGHLSHSGDLLLWIGPIISSSQELQGQS